MNSGQNELLLRERDEKLKMYFAWLASILLLVQINLPLLVYCVAEKIFLAYMSKSDAAQ